MSIGPQGAVKVWWEDARDCIEGMMSALYFAHSTIGYGRPALLAAVDQLAAASKAANMWLPSHPCPDPNLNDRFTRMLRSAGGLAVWLEDAVCAPRDLDVLTVDREIALVTEMMTEALAHLGGYQEE
jgi:hypothetical protein